MTKVPGKPFQPGQSGNPGGRSKIAPEVAEILRAASPEAARALVEIASNPKHKDQMRAIENILDRTLGKARQPIGLDPDDSASNAIAGSLAQVMALLDQSIRAGQAGRSVADGVEGSPSPGTDPAPG